MTEPSRTHAGFGWVTLALLPAVNLALALLLSAVVVLLVGESPARALRILATGAFGDAEAIGYTLYYATNFVFTGLAVAVAFHGGLFNIGAEGQADPRRGRARLRRAGARVRRRRHRATGRPSSARGRARWPPRATPRPRSGRRA